MPSFDVVSEVDLQEVRNAVDQANREVSQRFDFKGTNSHIDVKEAEVILHSNSEFQLKQMMDILENKLIKRKVDIGSLDRREPELQTNAARQLVIVRQGIESELARKIVKEIKAKKLKVQSQIQGEQVRVTGKKRDDLQTVITYLKSQDYDLPLQYINFRD